MEIISHGQKTAFLTKYQEDHYTNFSRGAKLIKQMNYDILINKNKEFYFLSIAFKVLFDRMQDKVFKVQNLSF